MSKSFNTQPPEGGWLDTPRRSRMVQGFNTQPPEGGWTSPSSNRPSWLVSTHSRLKAAGCCRWGFRLCDTVSTHSRLKAAGHLTTITKVACVLVSTHSRLKAAGGVSCNWCHIYLCFNTQPPEGGWINSISPRFSPDVSTHSRLKAAGKHTCLVHICIHVSTHSRLKAAG